jgi:hypothetical protein
MSPFTFPIMRRRPGLLPVVSASVMLAFATPAAAQSNAAPPAAGAAQDPTARLRAVLPADVAERVIARIAEAKARGLAGDALEQRALKFAARGVPAGSIEQAVSEHAERQARASEAIARGRAGRAAADEIDAGAEAMRQGVNGQAISELAKSAPSGRSLAVPLAVIGELQSRGLPSDDALARVRERLAARASDRDLADMPGNVAQSSDRAMGNRPANAGKPALTGRDLAATKRPASAGGPGNGNAGGASAGVPAAPGRGAAAAGQAAGKGNRPATPPGRGRPPA